MLGVWSGLLWLVMMLLCLLLLVVWFASWLVNSAVVGLMLWFVFLWFAVVA